MSDATALVQPRAGAPFTIYLARLSEDLLAQLSEGQAGVINVGQLKIKAGDNVHSFHLEPVEATCDIVNEKANGIFEDVGPATQKISVGVSQVGMKRPGIVSASVTAPAPKKTVQQMGAAAGTTPSVSAGPSRVELRRKLVHYLALHPRQTLGELRRAIIDNNDALQKELLLLLSAVAEKPEPGRYILKSDAYNEVEPDKYSGYTQADRAAVRENMRLAASAAGRDVWLTPIPNLDDPLVVRGAIPLFLFVVC